MSVPVRAIPFGLRDVKLIPLGADGATPGSPVDLPISQTLSFSEEEDFEELRGDDQVAASHGSGPNIAWELESGGISLEAYATIAGGTVTVTGMAPNEVKTYRKMTTDVRPYFKIIGRAINDNGGDFHGVIYRAKADGSLEGSMEDGSFWISSASGTGYGSLESGLEDRVYDFVHNETAVEIAGGPALGVNELQDIIFDATGGTFTIDFDENGPSAALTLTDVDENVNLLRAALEDMSDPGDFVVTRVGEFHYRVEFVGGLAQSNQPQLAVGIFEIDALTLVGGSQSAIVITVREGAAP